MSALPAAMGRPGLSLSPGKAWNLRVETGKGTGQNEQNGAGIQGWDILCIGREPIF